MKNPIRQQFTLLLIAFGIGGPAHTANICRQAHHPSLTPILDQLQTFAKGTVPDLRDPVQATLFHLYRLRYMGDPTTQLHAETTAQIATFLQAHPELDKSSFQSVSVDLAAPVALPEKAARLIQQTKQSSVMIFGKIIQIEANSGFWNKIFENVPSPASTESKGLFGTLAQTVVDKSKQAFGTRWKEFLPEPLLTEIASSDKNNQQKAILLFRHLQKLRTDAIEKNGGETAALKALSQVMVDLIQTMPFSSKETVEMLKADNAAVSFQVFDSLLRQRDHLSQELGFKNFAHLLSSLEIKHPSALSLPNEKFMAVWNEIHSEGVARLQKELMNTTFTVRQLSLAESVFRSCLGGNECSSRTYPEKALDPNYIYFTATDSDFHSDAHITVVLGTGQINGERQKIAFIDKIQNVPAERIAPMIEGVRRSLAENKYLLAASKETDDSHSGLSNSPSTRAFFKRFVDLEDRPEVRDYRPHTHGYNFQSSHSTRYSRAENPQLTMLILGPIETSNVQLQVQAASEFRPARSSELDLRQLAKDSYRLKDGSDQDKVVYIKTQDVLKGLGLRDPGYKELSFRWLGSPEISFAIKKQIILTSEPNQILALADTKLSETEKPRFFTAVVSSPFYRKMIGVENIYRFLEDHPEYMRQISSESLAGFSLQKILRLELNELFAVAVEAPGAKINQASGKTGNTAVHVAAKSGSVEKMQKLVEKNADFSVINHEGRTPLMRSLIGKQTEMSLYILEQPGELNLDQVDVDGHTALSYAIKYGQIAVIHPLIRRGASAEFRNLYGVVESNALFESIRQENAEALKAVIAAQVLPLDGLDSKGFTPLMRAAMAGQEELVRILLAAGASKDLTSPNGNTAVKLAQKRGYEMIARLLL